QQSLRDRPPLPREVPAWVEFTVTMRVSIEPGNDLVGRFGDTVVLISRGSANDASANELLGLVADLAADREAPVTAADGVRNLSGEQALTWVDHILPGTFEWLAIGGADGAAVHVDPISDLRAGVVPGHGFILNGAGGSGPAVAATPAS